MQAEEKQESKECFKCGYYTPYYTQGYFKFSKTHVGYCRREQKCVESHNGCEL